MQLLISRPVLQKCILSYDHILNFINKMCGDVLAVEASTLYS